MHYDPIILASASPRRAELLQQVHVPIADTFAPQTDETINPKLTPRENAKNIAMQKLQVARQNFPDTPHPILAADTIIAKGRQTIIKPHDKKDAERIIKSLSGRRHKVITAIAVASPQKIFERQVTSVVKFKTLSQTDIDTYLDTNEWHDKSGAYALQGHASRFIAFISGSYSNIVGLPLFETCQILATIQQQKTLAKPQKQI